MGTAAKHKPASCKDRSGQLITNNEVGYFLNFKSAVPVSVVLVLHQGSWELYTSRVDS
jgi:hypothetical protein